MTEPSNTTNKTNQHKEPTNPMSPDGTTLETTEQRITAAPLSGGVLRALAHDGSISYESYNAALSFIGIRPGPFEWRIFWQNILSICGTLFLASGIIFFFAWNWSGMHHFTKFALIGGVLAGSVLLALWRGLDSLPGRLALLLGALSVGPLLAVFGQTYQSGANAWELFRAWGLVIFPFALVGRQAALWLIFWMVSAGCWFLYTDSLFMPGYHGIAGLPEFFLAQALGVAVWEAALNRWGKTPEHAWLDAIWLPRLVVFCAGGAMTIFLINLIIETRHGGHNESLFLPERATIICLYAASMVGGWSWYRHKRRDLFMLACGVFSIASLIVAIIIRSEILSWDAGSLLLWGLILAGIGAGAGRILRHWQHNMEQEEHAEQEASGNAHGNVQEGNSENAFRHTVKTGFFNRIQAQTSWSALWEHLRALELLPPGGPPQVTPRNNTPWYISLMLAFGGWVAGLFFIGFLAVLLFTTMDINHNQEVSLLIGGLIFLGIAWALLRKSGIFLEQFGIALGIAGMSCVAFAIIWLSESINTAYLTASLVIAATYPLMPSKIYRFLAAMTAPVMFIWGINIIFFDLNKYSDIAMTWLPFGLQVIYFTLLCLALTWSWLHERIWLSRGNNNVTPLLHGSYCALLLALLLSISSQQEIQFSSGLFFPIFEKSIGLGAGVGLIYLALHLTSGIPWNNPARWLYLFMAALSMVLGWYLPGVTVALFGLALSRYLGDKVTLGLTGFALFAYIFYYYYNLRTTLLHKSITLMLIGLVLLLAAYALRRVFGADAEPAIMGERHA